MKKLVLELQPLCMNRKVQFPDNSGLNVLERRQVNLAARDDSLQKVDSG
jgi:hypothetical protein